jgi:hypothetical protein
MALLERRAEHDVIDQTTLDAGALDRSADRMRRERGRGGVVEGTAISAANGGAGGGNDDGGTQGVSSFCFFLPSRLREGLGEGVGRA